MARGRLGIVASGSGLQAFERLETRGRPSYDLPQLHEAAAAARNLLARRGWL